MRDRSDLREESSRPDCNLVLLIGACSRPVVVRELPSGSEVAELQVTTRVDGLARSVPVSVDDPAAAIRVLDAGDEVAVLGIVRRRFFRSGGVTASRVEVEARVVVARSDRRRLSALVRRAIADIGDLGGSPKPGSGATRRYSD